MRPKMTLRIVCAILLAGPTLLTGCKHDMDDYTKQHYSIPDEERVKYAEQKLGVTIDPEQDWVLTSEYGVTITADAALDGISTVAVLDGNPYAGTSSILAYETARNDASVTLSFRAPSASEVLYAACFTGSGKCIARPFIPGQEQRVSFVVRPEGSDSSRGYSSGGDSSGGDSSGRTARYPVNARAAGGNRAQGTTVIDYPTYKKFSIKDFFNFRKALYENLPEGNNNTDKLKSDFGSKVRLKYNDFNFYELPLVFLGGIGKPDFETDNDNLGYLWTPYDHSGGADLLLKDHFKNAFQPKYDGDTKTYTVEGIYLMALDADRKPVTQFAPNDVVYFKMYIGEEPVDEYSGQRVKVFQMNGELFVACEDGDDWDFNDRLFWFPYGTANLEVAEEHFDPIPSVQQTWTYAWEDQDFGDYDLNDCVIEVQENANNKNELDVKLVALGGTRELWLGFDNKNAQSYYDYKPVFDKELHSVLGIPLGKMANTGNGTLKADPVTITVAKPEGFDFQKCSFILGARFEQDQRGIYDTDYYAIQIAKKGQDPHGIIIPGKWQWPTERTCIINAYLSFADWAHDISNPTAKNWYMTPVDGKVIKR